MPKVSINILTKNRAQALDKALNGLKNQSFQDFEAVIINDGSNDQTNEILSKWNSVLPLKIIHNKISKGITASRQEAFLASQGEYIAVLDDDDEWVDAGKLKKQAEYLDSHPKVVLVGGGIKILNFKFQISKMRPETDEEIRKTMLFRNNFFTSTVMFRKQAAIEAGGFIKDNLDLAEDYDLWLRLGKLGKMYNFQEAFANYSQPSYNKEKFKAFFNKQLRLIKRHKGDYPHYWFSALILKVRLLL